MSEPASLSEFLSSCDAVERLIRLPETVCIDDILIRGGDRFSDIFLVQALIGLLNRSPPLTLKWTGHQAATFFSLASKHAILGCMLLHDKVRHEYADGTIFPTVKARLAINQSKLVFDWFSEPKALLCGDHFGLGRQRELYLSSASTGIQPLEHFEELIYPYVETQLAVGVEDKTAFKWRAALTSIVFELFENTDLHGRTDWNGKVLQNSIRGLLFRDAEVSGYHALQKKSPAPIRCLEIGVFDSGVGYYGKYCKKQLTDIVPIQEEWDVLHQCLSTHLEDGAVPNVGEGQRGIGLYEVLRALKFLNGAIEFRTGHIHAYRSFLPGDLLVQMEPSDSKLRPNMPKPALLDYSKKYFSKPTKETAVSGTAVRVLIPV